MLQRQHQIFPKKCLFTVALGGFTLHGAARHDEIFFHGSNVLEFTLAGHLQLTTKALSLELGSNNILRVC